MTNSMFSFLTEMTVEMFTLIGSFAIPLIVLILFRAGRMRGLTNSNMSERLGDLCFDTIKEKIRERVEELLTLNGTIIPPGRTILDILNHLHEESESLEQLLSIYKNLTEFGLQSNEFQLILQFLAQ